ncbi:MAG: glycosyltransferase family A protein [Phycisphaerae bacterium]
MSASRTATEERRRPRSACGAAGRPVGVRSASVDVSVIIPTYHSAAMVVEAVRSALMQTRRPREVIVVDDGSTDDTAAVLATLAAADGDRLRVVRQANAGPGAARNRGLSEARGAWVALLDADDLWLPHKLAAQLDCAARCDSDCVLCGLFWPTPRGEQAFAYRGRLDRAGLLAAMMQSNVLAGGCTTALLRRDALARVGPFDEQLKACEDRDFFFRVADRCRVAYVAEPLARRRVGPVQFGGDARRNLAIGELLLERHARLLARGPLARVWLRRARARLFQRAGLHCLYAGQRREAFAHFGRAARLWPLLPDPWRAAINALLGRLPRGDAPAGSAPI